MANDVTPHDQLEKKWSDALDDVEFQIRREAIVQQVATFAGSYPAVSGGKVARALRKELGGLSAAQLLKGEGVQEAIMRALRETGLRWAKELGWDLSPEEESEWVSRLLRQFPPQAPHPRLPTARPT